MTDFGQAFQAAVRLVLSGDRELFDIVVLSLCVSLTATAIAGVVGAALGAMLAVYRVPGKTGILVVVNAFLGLPPVVVGLVVYLLISRSGPFG